MRKCKRKRKRIKGLEKWNEEVIKEEKERK